MTQPSELEDRKCRTCGEIKLLTEFKKDDRRRAGRDTICKPCVNSAVRRIYEANPAKKYAKNEIWRKDNWEKVKQIMQQRTDPVKDKARRAVNNALRVGTLEKADCQKCNSTKTDFHHTNGYDRENWLTGMWLCRKHHAQLHKELRWQTK